MQVLRSWFSFQDRCLKTDLCRYYNLWPSFSGQMSPDYNRCPFQSYVNGNSCLPLYQNLGSPSSQAAYDFYVTLSCVPHDYTMDTVRKTQIFVIGSTRIVFNQGCLNERAMLFLFYGFWRSVSQHLLTHYQEFTSLTSKCDCKERALATTKRMCIYLLYFFWENKVLVFSKRKLLFISYEVKCQVVQGSPCSQGFKLMGRMSSSRNKFTVWIYKCVWEFQVQEIESGFYIQ